jgi:transporter family-2 protein
MFVGLILAFFSGVTRTLGRMVNARLSEKVGALQSTFYNYVVGLACSLLALSLFGAESARAAPAAGVPVWAYLGGAVGVAFIILANVTTPHISAYSMTTLIFVGQIATGIAMEAAMGGVLSPFKIAGGFLILAGLFVDWRKKVGPAAKRG